MSAAGSPKTAHSRRSRRSIAHLPTPAALFDKENNTIHGTVSEAPSRKTGGRRLKSKSLGPGGLEALVEGSGNRQKILPGPRSILKPSIPLSPPKAIPPHSSSRKTSPSKGSTHSLLDNVTEEGAHLQQSGVDSLANPFDDVDGVNDDQTTRVNLKTEDEQRAAQRLKEKQDILDRRDARRKSLANRRVSFAPEATLHTWDVVELPEDATSSSEATNSTRRASNGTTLSTSPFSGGDLDPTDPPSTPPNEDVQVAASPAPQRELHQKKRRQSSGIPPLNFNDPEDLSSSPVSSAGSDDAHQALVSPEDIVDASESDEDQDLVEGEETVTSVDNDDNTSQSVLSRASDPSNTGSSDRLDEALRQASRHASNQATEYDEQEDMTMEMANEEVTNAFKLLLGKERPCLGSNSISGTQKDQENVDSRLHRAIPGAQSATAADDEQETTMDITQAVGGILVASEDNQSPKRVRRKSIIPSRRRNSNGRRRSSGDTILEDETMEFTTALGGIQPKQPDVEQVESESVDGDEDMTMELTSVVGGVLDKTKDSSVSERDYQLANEQLFVEESQNVNTSSINGDVMDMTVAMGGILSPVTERTEPSEDSTAGMDITAAVGAILPPDLKMENRSSAKMLMEEEADHGQLTRSPFPKQELKGVNLLPPNPVSAGFTTSETGSPSLAGSQIRTTRRSHGTRSSLTPKGGSTQTTPLKKPTTPSKQLTPQPIRPTTPSKTPPAKNVSMRKTSPKKLFKAEIRKARSSNSLPNTPDLDRSSLQFSKDAKTGIFLPNVILTPQIRRPSGIGIEQQGMGSPRVAAILDRRVSIGDQAGDFVPKGFAAGSVRFADPRILEQELDHERAEDQRRGSGRGILQMEADAHNEDNDVTGNLRDMIGSLTPKRNKLKGRKSLAVGAAKGLLGKRPAELDDDDEDATPKRLKGIERSPVKSVHLPAPPSKSETTGRLGKAPQFGLNEAMGNVSNPTSHSIPEAKATTPKDQSRFKDAAVVKSASKPPASFNEQLKGIHVEMDPAAEDDRIHLKDFLDMTSIRFMELTTTKRRHTVMPDKVVEDGLDDTLSHIPGHAQTGDDRQLSSCVVAGASTVPMLELYQHSCRELKKYISEGRSIVKEIEADTFEENPPLFREYMTASPQIRSIMDNQFKNVKTHARLLSKAMWYEWRMKLLDGLKEGLLKIGNGLQEDANLLAQQEAIVGNMVPELVRKHEELECEVQLLQSQADELANCNQEELRDARERLFSADEEAATKRAQIEALQFQLLEKEQSIQQVALHKSDYAREIEEAERVREECRGWSSAEVASLKANVEKLQKSTGWTITAATEESLTLAHQRSLSLFVNPASFYPHAPSQAQNSSISLSCAKSSENDAISTTHRFFLQYLRARLLAIVQAQTPLKDVLALVSSGWALATQLAQQVEDLQTTWPTAVAISGDEKLSITSTLLMRDMQTKADIAFEVVIGGERVEATAAVAPTVSVVYGEDLKEDRMREFLRTRIGLAEVDAGNTVAGFQGWAKAVEDLESRLRARGRKEKA